MVYCFKIHIAFLLYIIILSPTQTWSKNIITLDQNKYNLQNNLEWLEDPTGTLSLKDILTNKKSYIFNKHDAPPLQNTQSTFWFKFSFFNPDTKSQKWFFQSDYYSMDYFNWYSPLINGKYHHEKLGLRDPFSQRSIKQRNPTVQILLPPQKETIFYLQIQSTRSPVNPKFNLLNESIFLEKSLSEHSFFSFFLGAMFLITIYNLFLFCSLRNLTYLYYSLFQGSVTILLIIVNGYSYEYLKQDSVWLEYHGFYLFHGIVNISLLQFTRLFLKTNKNFAKADTLLLALIPANMTTFLSITGSWQFSILIIIIASIVWGLWYKKGKLNTKYNLAWKLSLTEFTICFLLWHFAPYLGNSGPSFLRAILTISTMLHILIISGICWTKNSQEGKYMLCTWIILGTAVLYARLTEIMILPFSGQIENIVLIGLMLEASILAFAIAYRFRITEIEKYKAQKQAILNLKESDKVKDEFLAKISHEFRTPLHGILGMCQNLFDDIKNKNYAKLHSGLNLVESCSHQLLYLVNDILDISQIHKSGIKLHCTSLNIRTILKNTINTYQPLAQQKNITLSAKIPNNLPNIWADQNRLQQILDNLLGNAIKFTNKGSVELQAHQENNKIYIKVIDTGIGISKEIQDQIFTAFKQGDTNHLMSSQGTGLGLTIAQYLLELHNSTLTLKSAPQQGSCFSFTLLTTKKPENNTHLSLPRIQNHKASISKQILPTKQTTPYNILIVDDDPINLQILLENLTQQGFSTITATNGKEALKKIKQSSFHLILMDIMMPEMDGFTTCQEIRKEFSKQELPIIFVTAKNQIEDFLKGLIVGGNDYLVKPFSREELYARLNSQLMLSKEYTKLSLLNKFWNQTDFPQEQYETLLQKIVNIFENYQEIQGINLYAHNHKIRQDFNDNWLKESTKISTEGNKKFIQINVYCHQTKNPPKSSTNQQSQYALNIKGELLMESEFNLLLWSLPTKNDLIYIQQIFQQFQQVKFNIERLLNQKTFYALCEFSQYRNKWVWIQANQKISLVKLSDGTEKHIDCTLKELSWILPKEESIQIHRSYLVSSKQIHNIRRRSSSRYEILINGTHIPIGTNYWPYVKQFYKRKTS